MKRYNPKELEPKWQKTWQESGIYNASEDPDKPKRYVLEYFPYPSGAAMHVGHVRNYTIGDVVARHYRMRGYNVLHPMGWDAFGLPAENYAIKTGTSPRKAVDENTAKFKKQLMQMGFSYDWTREIDSTDPNYYKWTQWFFLMLFQKGLAYQKEALVNWDPVEKTVLANEQVIDGRGERSGALVEKKALKQWFFKITDYADRLEEDLDDLDWTDAIKTMQRNWIGKSKGAEIDFYDVDDNKQENPIKVFTTRPDTLFGATFLVLAPEHPLVAKLTSAEQKKAVEEYVKKSQALSEIDRQETDREKTGVFTGGYALNPASGEHMPIWIADYVLAGYGTGAIMAVPAHDERDFEFAKKFDLDCTEVIDSPDSNKKCYAGEGILKNSGDFDGMESSEARDKITAWLQKEGWGKEKVNYKLRDWLISRQRYWGAPIPIVYDPDGKAHAVPEEHLPWLLPEDVDYKAKDASPLGASKELLERTEKIFGKGWTPETDTMDGFACSSWYFLRFVDPNNSKEAFAKDKAQFWLPVDDYIGGAEHAVMHLLYARFWTKVMYDEGLITFNEPFKALRNQGMILAPDGLKMSKSKGNTIEPDGLIEQGYGADATRIMELFIGPYDQSAAWSVEGMGGSFRFLQRVWTLTQEYLAAEKGDSEDKTIQLATHKTIKKVSDDLHSLSFNTAIAALMEYVNELYKIKAQDGFKAGKSWAEAIETLLKLLAPFAPHISEELWSELGNKDSVHTAQWPVHDEKLLVSDNVTIVVQVNGKVRANLQMPSRDFIASLT